MATFSDRFTKGEDDGSKDPVYVDSQNSLYSLKDDEATGGVKWESVSVSAPSLSSLNPDGGAYASLTSASVSIQANNGGWTFGSFQPDTPAAKSITADSSGDLPSWAPSWDVDNNLVWSTEGVFHVVPNLTLTKTAGSDAIGTGVMYVDVRLQGNAQRGQIDFYSYLFCETGSTPLVAHFPTSVVPVLTTPASQYQPHLTVNDGCSLSIGVYALQGSAAGICYSTPNNRWRANFTLDILRIA